MGANQSHDISIVETTLASFKDAKLVHAMEKVAIDGIGGGCLFFGGVHLTQLLMFLGRVSASTPAIPTILGSLGVASSSILVGAYCLRDKEPSLVQMTGAAMTGLLLFRLLGGRFHALAPSDFRHPGAFGHEKISLPATLEYADGNARAIIQYFGRLYGCHTCGTRSAVAKFHADHQPPVMVAKAENARLWNKWIAGPVIQRYYPQCGACSNIQGAQVKKNAKKLKLHLTSIRSYHLTGFWMVLFGASGLGSFTIAADSEVKPQTIVDHVAEQATEVFQPYALQRLREHEKQLNEELRSTADPSRKKIIEKELSTIRDSKAHIKAQLRQLKR